MPRMPIADAIAAHWPEYLMELGALACFMVSAAVVGAAAEHPHSPLRLLVDDPLTRRALIGVAMGLTACALIYSPWGRRSGAHMNPSVTLAFVRLGTIAPHDALCYVVAQFIGAFAGLAVAAALLGGVLAHPAVNYVATHPGAWGAWAAFAAEWLISFALMLVVLVMSNRPRLARFTGGAVAMLLTAYIALEAPLSGMSMNPARTLASNALAGEWSALWIYFVAPPLGMLTAAELWRRGSRQPAAHCAKLHHDGRKPCIFRCSHDRMLAGVAAGHSR